MGASGSALKENIKVFIIIGCKLESSTEVIVDSSKIKVYPGYAFYSNAFLLRDILLNIYNIPKKNVNVYALDSLYKAMELTKGKMEMEIFEDNVIASNNPYGDFREYSYDPITGVLDVRNVLNKPGVTTEEDHVAVFLLDHGNTCEFGQKHYSVLYGEIIDIINKIPHKSLLVFNEFCYSGKIIKLLELGKSVEEILSPEDFLKIFTSIKLISDNGLLLDEVKQISEIVQRFDADAMIDACKSFSISDTTPFIVFQKLFTLFKRFNTLDQAKEAIGYTKIIKHLEENEGKCVNIEEVGLTKSELGRYNNVFKLISSDPRDIVPLVKFAEAGCLYNKSELEVITNLNFTEKDFRNLTLKELINATSPEAIEILSKLDFDTDFIKLAAFVDNYLEIYHEKKGFPSVPHNSLIVCSSMPDMISKTRKSYIVEGSQTAIAPGSFALSVFIEQYLLKNGTSSLDSETFSNLMKAVGTDQYQTGRVLNSDYEYHPFPEILGVDVCRRWPLYYHERHWEMMSKPVYVQAYNDYLSPSASIEDLVNNERSMFYPTWIKKYPQDDDFYVAWKILKLFNKKIAKFDVFFDPFLLDVPSNYEYRSRKGWTLFKDLKNQSDDYYAIRYNEFFIKNEKEFSYFLDENEDYNSRWITKLFTESLEELFGRDEYSE